MASTSRHVFRLFNSEPYFTNAHGTIHRATAENLLILRGMSLKKLTLRDPGTGTPTRRS